MSSSPVAHFTHLEADRPISKQFWEQDGRLRSETIGAIGHAHYQGVACTLAQLRDSIATFDARHANISGLNGAGSGVLVSQSLRAAIPGSVSRTKECFAQADGVSGLLRLDYDSNPGGGAPLDAGGLLAALVSAWPVTSRDHDVAMAMGHS